MQVSKFWVLIFSLFPALLFAGEAAVVNQYFYFSEVYVVESGSSWGDNLINDRSTPDIVVFDFVRDQSYDVKIVDNYGDSAVVEDVVFEDDDALLFVWNDSLYDYEGTWDNLRGYNTASGYTFYYADLGTESSVEPEPEELTEFVSSGDTLDPVHTSVSEIRERWVELKPDYEGTPYDETPSTSRPYSTGSLNEDFMEDGLNYLNFCRFLAGLPDDVEMSDEKNELGQYGAVTLAGYGYLSHYPSKPSGMSEDFFEMGAESCSSANIGQGYSDLEESISGYMGDEDTGNMDRVGHRRWILNPPLKYVGFGFANGSGWNFTTTQVFDWSRTETVDYTAVCWPSPGYFPSEFFAETSYWYGEYWASSHPWSVSLNSDLYSEPKLSDVTVTLTSLDDGSSWTLDKNDDDTSEMDEYFTINTAGYGISYCIIFRPPSEGANYSSGQRYQVEIDGLKTTRGDETSLSYTVEFFDLE